MNRQQDKPSVDFVDQLQQRSRDRQRLRKAFEHHVLTPDCKSCREDFETALAAYREKYA